MEHEMDARVTAHDTSSMHRLIAAATLLVLGAVVFCQSVYSQEQEPAPLTPAELEELVGPIALYPDDLLGIVLPASTYPLQIVQAARFLEDRAEDSSLEPDQEWDDSIVALLNYPEVVAMMNEDLEWTWALGEAVLDDQAAVIDAVQVFRDRAYAAGNLRSDARQVVTEDDGVIEIAPADPEVIYIPYYEPERVVIYQPSPAYYYYPYAYPLYYYPYPVGYAFSSPFFWGVTSAFTIGWHTHFLHVHHHTHFGHPYYGHSYYTYAPFYWRNNVHRHRHVDRVAYVWEPDYRRGAQPHLRDDGRRVRAVYEGRSGTRRADARSDGAARVLQGGDASRPGAAGTTRTVTTTRRTIGGVADRTLTERTATARAERAEAERRTGTARVLRENDSSTVRTRTGITSPRADGNGVPNRTAPNRASDRAAERTSITPRATRSPQRTIGGVASRSVAPSIGNAGIRMQRDGGRSVAPRAQPSQRSIAPQPNVAQQRNSAPQRSAPAERSAPQRSAPAPQRSESGSAPRSGGVARGGGAGRASREGR
jgi:Protein of unknown function (DUF3300)